MWPLLLVVAPPVLVVAALALTTTQGARRRGHRWLPAVLAGVAFPVTWALWYAVDRHAAPGSVT